MDLEDKIDATQIVTEAKMCARPEYYSCRGAILSDLNSDILEKVYQGVEREHGRDAAENFAQMVADIPKLSATDFLVTLYRLEANGWNWDTELLGDERGVYIDGRTDDQKFASGMNTLAGGLSRMYGRDETPNIREAFLTDHGIEIPRSDCPIGYSSR